jgi:hypothetical protein
MVGSGDAAMDNRFVRIVYDENGGLASYTHVQITKVDGENVKTFDSGDVVADFAAMRDWLREHPIDPSTGRTMFTSSVDHFCMDVPGFKWIEDELGRELIVAMTPEEAERQKAYLAEEENA